MFKLFSYARFLLFKLFLYELDICAFIVYLSYITVASNDIGY